MAENNSEIIQDLNNNEEVTNGGETAVEGATASVHENHAKNDNELLDMVFTLESEKQQLVEESRKRMSALRKDLEEALGENEKLKRKVNQLEQSLKQSVMLGGVDAPKTRQDQEELLLKAKTLLFEKTKVNKQQEHQIATMKTQVDAMKDVVQVTKDMLNLKTAECNHMQERLNKAQLWVKAEQDKCTILEKKLQISKNVYDKLKSEHELQTKIHRELKSVYEEKVKLLNDTIDKLK
ncbi:ELKS/Rab6-interacting/CAST family member 1 [Musca domestica]|uniref:ELKS/Rab6-interacting/CAST family member 1 n=1 Tax=Musca domestica TaxID=7370 RepID=A0A1I8MKK3_MUSDO|nr:ELKS/Rab6-interacting/CAST family member 1 [Musca domestica]